MESPIACTRLKKRIFLYSYGCLLNCSVRNRDSKDSFENSQTLSMIQTFFRIPLNIIFSYKLPIAQTIFYRSVEICHFSPTKSRFVSKVEYMRKIDNEKLG